MRKPSTRWEPRQPYRDNPMINGTTVKIGFFYLGLILAVVAIDVANRV